MSTIDLPSSLRPAEITPASFQFTRELYYRLSDAGLFQNHHVQLIEGQLIEMAPQRNQHAACVRIAGDILRAAFGTGYTVQTQLPLDLGEYSQPEPDLAVLAGSPRQHLHHPTEALLVVEVSDTSLRYDRETKSQLYASAGLPEYWIINLVDRQLEVFRSPIKVPSPRYTEKKTIAFSEMVFPLSAIHAQIAIADLLP